jgi:hypothetical protein
MSQLDGHQHVQAKASRPETVPEKEWFRGYTGSPPTCLEFPDFLDRSPCLQTYTPHMAPHANHVTVTPASLMSAPNSELEDTLHSRTLSLPELMACSREGHHEANNFADTKTCFLEESLLFDYNPILDTSLMYTDVPAEDRGTSTSVLKLPPTNADVGHWLFEMATPTVVGETLSNSTGQDEHGMQSNQAVSSWELSNLSTSLRVEKSPAGDVQSTIALPPNAVASVATKQKGSPNRKQTNQKGSTNQKPYRDTDILMGRGGNATYHPGNKRYLVAMKKCLVQYHNSERSEKIKVSQQVVDEVHAWGGRFLKRVKGSNEYVEVSNKIARTRVSQALRDGKGSE